MLGTPTRHCRGSSVDFIGGTIYSPVKRSRQGGEEGVIMGEDEDGTPRATTTKSHLPLNSPRRRPHSTSSSTIATPPSRKDGIDSMASPSPAFALRSIPSGPSVAMRLTSSALDQSARLEASTRKSERAHGSSELEGISIEGRRDAPEARATVRRTEAEKKELLREVLGNVDALEERFKNIALGLKCV